MNPRLEEIVENINRLLLMDEITDEDRLEFIKVVGEGFCKHCGKVTEGQTCYCWNDE